MRVPSERTVLLQASPRLYFLQNLYPLATPDSRYSFQALERISRYRQPGPAPGVSFAHGPVGPAPERRIDRYSVGPYCIFCRYGVHLNGGFSLWTGAGTRMFGFLGRGDANWSLRRDGQRLAGGGSYMNLHKAVPPGVRAYVLRASAHPQSPLWRLSTTVTDAWTFKSAAGREVIPILIPRYVPHTTPSGTMAPGHTTLRLDFGNLGPVRSVVQDAHVSLSVDSGKTWTSATVTRIGPDSFRVGYVNPPSVGIHRFMSLRVSATDAGGRHVTETALRVYRLLPRR